ncbi:hypothetical protein B0H15DRAFT_788651 [Mycena belliarum]|uniref:Uncharacterized protein n=1 Tax=Mycena belliarum TaxID=1033014 RepID=A0AAD6TVJ4_9AGAR|nr:hypothetical protein B0H15DRAFT_788651 [Mycena belliae]
MTRFTHSESQGLSTTRISRLLRPLRTKCIALKSATTREPEHPTATYGSKTQSVMELLPLDVLPPPDSARSYHVDHSTVATLRAAIYAVRDCFQEIVSKTKAPEAPGLAPTVPRLADLCSIIVGEHMEADDDFGTGTDEDSGQLGEIENLYGLIPVQYRRSALLAHALDIVLRGPHHFTLLSILLDVSLYHGLAHESCILLHWLMRVVVSRSRAGATLRLCHLAHSNYLVDLAHTWQGAGRPMSVFLRILTDTLATAARPELWRCKALGKLARQLHNHDFHSFIDLAGRLLRSIGNRSTADPVKSRPKYATNRGTVPSQTTDNSLADQLNRWLNYSCPFSPSSPSESSLIVEFLERCGQSRAHHNITLAPTLVCWATHYLSVVPGPDARAVISRLLKDTQPTVTTYNLLVEQSFGITPTSTRRLQDCRIILETYASSLRAEHLLLLEASLRACTLRFVEASRDSLMRGGTEREVRLYQEEVMDLVEDAERRCFGSGLRSDLCVDAIDPGWRWERVLGCWVQCRLPVAKKAKHHHTHLAVGRTCANSRLRTSSLQSHAATDNDEYRNSSPSSFDLSFKSIVSSALSNRTELHDSKRNSECTSRSVHDHEPTVPPLCKNHTSEAVPESDDALNLFAYAELAPAAVH